ncbi:hypothetical protein [Chryseobacterium sp.]|uniref:hypothetical protein n=1 Tax=Chryseobacterium sp. TaxID=1871047 RepID=UPI0025B9F653|nr:hypothetical protein [Chryseobacterium sp.]MBV8328026.1 hypothetical protein [Chryseobacterium sp.]
MTISIKNKINWLITIIMGMGLCMTLVIILILIPVAGIQAILPFAAFFILFLYIWLWNTFGKTILTIEPDRILIRYKNKLFTQPRIFLKKEIHSVSAKDFAVEKYKSGVRYNISWSGATYSVVLINNNREEIRIVDWITKDRAEEIVDQMNKKY